MNKILILFVGVLVSIIVWAVGHHFFNLGFVQPVWSLAVSVLVGFIVSMIVWIIGKTWGSQTQTVVAIIAVATVGGVILHQFFAITGPVDVYIYCTSSGTGEYANPDPIIITTGNTVKWHFNGPGTIPIDINFDKGFQPFQGTNTFHGTPGSLVSSLPIIKTGYGCYSFTCGYTGGPKKIDPMIHVPQ